LGRSLVGTIKPHTRTHTPWSHDIGALASAWPPRRKGSRSTAGTPLLAASGSSAPCAATGLWKGGKGGREEGKEVREMGVSRHCLSSFTVAPLRGRGNFFASAALPRVSGPLPAPPPPVYLPPDNTRHPSEKDLVETAKQEGENLPAVQGRQQRPPAARQAVLRAGSTCKDEPRWGGATFDPSGLGRAPLASCSLADSPKKTLCRRSEQMELPHTYTSR